ncbi:MAG TPA: hypothetical protein VF352_07695, partial [Anaerolineales bacterium]
LSHRCMLNFHAQFTTTLTYHRSKDQPRLKLMAGLILKSSFYLTLEISKRVAIKNCLYEE